MRGDEFFYSRHILKTVAENYTQLYDGLSFKEGHITTDPWSLAEYKADFDMALRGIGRGNWVGEIIEEFKYYRNFGRLQRIIIADILGVGDSELVRVHFWDIPRLRGYAYYLMCKSLNVDIKDKECYNKDASK